MRRQRKRDCGRVAAGLSDDVDPGARWVGADDDRLIARRQREPPRADGHRDVARLARRAIHVRAGRPGHDVALGSAHRDLRGRGAEDVVRTAAGRVPDGLRHLAKARSMVALPAKIGRADRETVVLYANIREQLAQALMKHGEPAAAAQALAEAVAAVRGGSSVPAWRAAEFERQWRAAADAANGRP